jgi:hypothetical protein
MFLDLGDSSLLALYDKRMAHDSYNYKCGMNTVYLVI